MYAWQHKQWQLIMQQGAKMPHALLLRGRTGIGKQDFALDVAKAILCPQASFQLPTEGQLRQACGNCPSCSWFVEGTHPDFMLIGAEDADDTEEVTKKKTTKKSQISVAKIRQLLDYLTLSSHQVNSYRVIIISPADMLNSASANALLKMLEEPSAKTLFLLVTSQPQRLLATITSRCQAVDMPLPSRADALAWLNEQQINNAENVLNLAGGAPLRALQMAEEGELGTSLLKNLALGAKLDPFTCAPLFLGLGMERAIEALQKWLFDMQAYKLAQVLRYHAQQANALQALAKSVNLALLLRFQDTLLEAKKTANHPLSNEAQLENILLQYTKIFKAH